jgi:predicted ATP-grasp superfamily ATP-dependent carboligase
VINVLVLSASASAINVIASLSRSPDLRLFVTDSSPFACGLYRAGVVPLLVPRARDLESYRTALDRIVQRCAIDLIVPTSDRDIEGIVELLHRGWNPRAKVFRPPYCAYRVLSNKARLAERVSTSDVPVPGVYSSPDTVEFPAVVKPVTEGGTRGVRIVHTRAQLASAIEQVRHAYGAEYVLQEYIPGGTGSVHVVTLLYDHTGQLIGAVAMRSSVTFMTWGGGGNAGSIVDEPEAIRLAERVVDLAGGWKGPVNVEFKRHGGTGAFHVMEANCRLNGYSYLATMNGMDFPHAIVDVLQHGRTARLTKYNRTGTCNFVLGFRETLVSHWVSETTPDGEA